jgi:hypothetical protein
MADSSALKEAIAVLQRELAMAEGKSLQAKRNPAPAPTEGEPQEDEEAPPGACEACKAGTCEEHLSEEDSQALAAQYESLK